MKETYIDLHTHTLMSDGAYTPEKLCTMAREAGIGILALTDHNYMVDLAPLQQQFPEIRFIPGVELNCRYYVQGQALDIHVVGLGVDPNHPTLKNTLARNNLERAPYINAILDRLRECGIDLGTYDTLLELYPETRQIGRMDIARLMKQRGHVPSVAEAFHLYIGALGKRLAYVPNPSNYVSLEEGVSAILAAGGIPVLAHLFYYGMSQEENLRLLALFKKLAGDRGAMEVYYSVYNQEERMALKALADIFGLMYSAASDFHGQKEGETLAHHFRSSDCAALLEVLGIGIEAPATTF